MNDSNTQRGKCVSISGRLIENALSLYLVAEEMNRALV